MSTTHPSPLDLAPYGITVETVHRNLSPAKLAGLFIENFKKFESGATAEVKAAGPKV